MTALEMRQMVRNQVSGEGQVFGIKKNKTSRVMDESGMQPLIPVAVLNTEYGVGGEKIYPNGRNGPFFDDTYNRLIKQ